jgi:hypothetical protein
MCPERQDLLEVLRAASAHVRALRQLEIEALRIEDNEELARLAPLVERAVELEATQQEQYWAHVEAHGCQS